MQKETSVRPIVRGISISDKPITVIGERPQGHTLHALAQIGKAIMYALTSFLLDKHGG